MGRETGCYVPVIVRIIEMEECYQCASMQCEMAGRTNDR